MTNVRRSMRRREGPMKRVFTSPGGGVEIPAGREQTFVLDGPHTSNWDEVTRLRGSLTSVWAEVDMKRKSKDTESEAIVRAGLTRLSGADKDLVKGSFFKKNMDAENVLLPVTLDGSNRKRLHGAVDGLPGTISYLGNETPGIGLLVASATQTIRLGWYGPISSRGGVRFTRKRSCKAAMILTIQAPNDTSVILKGVTISVYGTG